MLHTWEELLCTLDRAECMRCPWLQAETKVATILGTFFFSLVLLVGTVIQNPRMGLSYNCLSFTYNCYVIIANDDHEDIKNNIGESEMIEAAMKIRKSASKREYTS